MARAKKTTKKQIPSLEALKAAAEDFNSFMEFEEEGGIPFDDMDYDELKDEIVETASELEEEDVITAETAATLDELKVKYAAEVEDDSEEEMDTEEEQEQYKKDRERRKKRQQEEDEVEDEFIEEVELPTEAEIKNMKKAELVELAEELEVEVDGMKIAEMKDALIEAIDSDVDADDEDEDEEEPAEVEDEDEETPEAVPLKGKEAKVIKDAIDSVKKSKKLDDVKAIAKENGIRMPPPFLKDLKKLKPYVTEKLEDILSGEAVVKKAAPKKAKKPAGPTLQSFFEKNVKKEFDMKDEDEIVEAAKEEFPDKSYRVIGNALYGFVKKLG